MNRECLFEGLLTGGQMSPEIPAGWYPDPDGKPASRYWDGNQWTDQTRPQADSASAPTVFGYRSSDETFHGDLKQLMQLASRAINEFRWTITGANEFTQSLTFETKISWGSWSGVTCTLTFFEVQPGVWQVSGTGKQNVRGAQLAAIDLGESGRKAAKAIQRMRELAPPIR